MLHHPLHFIWRLLPVLWHGWLLVMIIGQIASWTMDGIVPWLKRRTHWGSGFRIEDDYPPRYPD